MRRSAIHQSHLTIETTGRLTLFCRNWREDAPHRAAVAIVHGYGDHSGRYDRLARYLVSVGCAVYAVDLRGHGMSPGKRGHIGRFEEYLKDAAALLKHVETAEPSVPVLMLGHSMGALIAIRLAEEHKFELAGLVISSPFLGIKMEVPAWKRAAATLLSRVLPRITMPSDLNVDWLTHDAEIIAETRRDPLVHRDATPRWYTEVLNAQETAIAMAGEIRLPVLLQVAGDDRIADAAVTEQFIERLSCPITVHRYDRLYHEIYNEVERAAVFADLARWIDSVTALSPSSSAQLYES